MSLSFKVGDKAEVAKDFRDQGWLAGTPVMIMTVLPDGRYLVEDSAGRNLHFHHDNLRRLSHSSNQLACPHCGDVDSFYQVNKSVNTSDIAWVDANSGEVHWTGDTHYGSPNEEIIGYKCGNCQTEIEDWYFDPNLRAAKDLAKIEEVKRNLDNILES